ncbi:MAG: hypothetical protein C4320_02970 [Armatimonadota bacterium]
MDFRPLGLTNFNVRIPLKTVSTLYDILGVAPEANPEALRKAYRKLAHRHHPDVSNDPLAHEQMARINYAFDTLIDTNLRAEYDGTLRVKILDIEGGINNSSQPIVLKLAQRMQGHQTPIYALDFVGGPKGVGTSVVSCGFDNELICWDTMGLPYQRVKLDAGVVSVLRGGPGERVIAAGASETQVSYWRIDEGKPTVAKAVPEEWVGAVAISPLGDRIAAGSVYRRVIGVDTATGETTFLKEDFGDSVTAVAFSDDGRFIAAGTSDARIHILEAESGRELAVLDRVRSTITALAFAADSRFLVAAGVDLSLRVFDVRSGGLEKMMFGHTRSVETMAFHPNGWLFASGARDGSVGFWNAGQGIGNMRIEASSRPITAIAFSPDGSALAAGGQDKLVRVWRIGTQKAE